MRRRSGLVALAAVAGPGLLAGLSDDDPAGITTYSILGADYGYQLLWVLVLSTAALILFHELGARMGVVTGEGLAGLIRYRYGIRIGLAALLALLIANIGTAAAAFAGIAAALELADVPRWLSAPTAGVAIAVLVLRGTFKRIEHVLIAACSVFVAYVFAAVLAHPDWGEAARGLVVPTLPATNEALLAATAVVGTTLAPWGLAFIQSYAVDKRLHPRDLGYERVDVVVGALLTGIIGFFVVVACAATLHVQGRSIEDAADAAVALEPVAGRFASVLFAAGLLGAGLIAAAILPLSTGYSVSEVVGSEAALDDSFRDAPLFYTTYFVVIVVAVGLVVAPDVPLVQVLYLTQALNAILLVPLLVLVLGLARDRELMGVHALGRKGTVLTAATIVLIGTCVAALGVFSAVG